MKIPEFKIRASSCGKIMGKKGLGVAGKTYCKTWLKSKLFNRYPEIKSKYLDKGNIMEDDSLDQVAKRLDLGILIKNEKYYLNKWIEGTPDAVLTNCVIDVKNSWSWETFPLIESEIPDIEYYWQLQCYMSLTKKKSAKLIYTLLDTPLNLIKSEAYFYSKKNGYGELTQEMFDKFKKKMTYGDIPEHFKYKSFGIDRNDADIALIKERVIECREYIANLLLMNPSIK